jgi:hypothetical protein
MIVYCAVAYSPKDIFPTSRWNRGRCFRKPSALGFLAQFGGVMQRTYSILRKPLVIFPKTSEEIELIADRFLIPS